MLRLIGFVAFVSCVFLAPPINGGARAGAFLQSDGDWQVITTSRFTGSSYAFDAKGKLLPLPLYSKYELSGLIEYGAMDWLTLIAQPTAASIFAEGPPQGSFYGFTSLEAGARAKIAKFDTAIVSAQATARFATVRNRANPALVGATGNEYDLRLLAGMPFEIEGFHGFLNAETAYRIRSDGPPNEIRMDLTAGIRPLTPLLLLAQSFNTWAPSKGAPGFPAMRQHKVQASAVWSFARGYSIQSGVYTTIAGRNVRHERGLVTGVWYKF